jgi:hypothetical protein
VSYGWRDFDQAIVKAIAGGGPEHIVKQPSGGMKCPFVGHEDWLTWQGDTHADGTVPHGSPEVVFRVKPTYILSERLDNFIVGHDLVSAAINNEWKKAETHRLGFENSEDALTFNVFRSLQEAGELQRVARLVTEQLTPEPDLFLWGRQINKDGTSNTWHELQAVRRKVEGTHGQPTEPDVCLHVHGWGWIFIEAKFGFGIKTSESAKKMKSWLALYPRYAPLLFDLEQIANVRHREFPEQLLRNMVFAHLIRAKGELAHVVALGRAKDKTPIEEWVAACLASDCPVTTSRMSWEQIYRALPADSAELAPLRSYVENKSYALRPAFSLSD